MKTKITAVLLLAVMLAGILAVPFSAANPTLQSYITTAMTQNPTTKYVIALTSTTEVNSATVIPANITVVVTGSGKLIVNAKLTVYGTLTASNAQLSIGSAGSIVYSNGTNYIPSTTTICPRHGAIMVTCTMCGVTYCPACLGGYHARDTKNNVCVVYSGNTTTCEVCGNTKNYCQYCNKYYCPVCSKGVHVYNPLTGSCYIYAGSVGGIITPPSTSYICPNNSSHTLVYCNYCNKYYCPVCNNGYHVYNPTTKTCSLSNSSLYYCSTHNLAKTYCSDCKTYYCPLCVGGTHIYDATNKVCLIYNGSNITYNPIYNGYYPGYEYVYVPGYGFLLVNTTAGAPTASIASGSTVEWGTQITLSTSTPNSTIYYTIDGTIPTANSIKYTGPITIKKTAAINAITISSTVYKSSVSIFKYNVKATSTPFTDVTSYPGLSISLNTLIDAGVISSAAKFNPAGKVSYDDLKTWFKALKIDIDSVNLSTITVADKDALTYEELVYISYKVLRANNIIDIAKKKASSSLTKLTYQNLINNLAIYKSAYASMIENDVLYAFDFKPKDAASRVYLATIIAWAANNK